MHTGQCLVTLEGHNNPVNSASFSNNELLIVSAANDNTVRVWDVKTGELLQTFVGHSNFVFSAAFSPDDRFIVSGGDQTVRLWEFPPLEELLKKTRERFKDRQLTREEQIKYGLE